MEMLPCVGLRLPYLRDKQWELNVHGIEEKELTGHAAISISNQFDASNEGRMLAFELTIKYIFRIFINIF